MSQISNLRNHDLARMDSCEEAREATAGEVRWPEATLREATLREAVESSSLFRLTDLPPLTYPLITEELRPQDPPRGRFSFPVPPHREPRPMDLVFAPRQVESWPIARLRP